MDLAQPQPVPSVVTIPAIGLWAKISRWMTIAGGAIVVAIAIWQFSAALHKSTFHPDESRWINRAVYLKELRHPRGGFWSDSYLIRGQPPMGSYITGLGLWLQGQPLEQNGPWNFAYGNDGDINWNVTNGNVPDVQVLLDARRTSIALGVLTILATYIIVTMLSNWIGGVVAGVFLSIHPLTIYLATLAVSDMAFTLVVALSGLCGLTLARRPSWLWTIALGVMLGTGASLKLSPIFLAFGLAFVGALILIEPVVRRIPGVRQFYRHFGAGEADVQRMGIMLLSLPVIATGFFIASYPYLWSDPIGRTRLLFDFRRAEMANQSRIWGDQAIDSRFEAISRTWSMLEVRYSTSGRLLASIGIEPGNLNSKEGYDMPFLVLGVVLFIGLALWYGFRTPHLMTLMVLAGQVLIILAGININFNRYYLPVAFFLAVGLGVGIGTCIEWIRVLWKRWRPETAPKTTAGGEVGPSLAAR
jgi:hypothetical protein